MQWLLNLIPTKAPSQDQVIAQIRLVIPALGVIATAFGLSSTEADHFTQAVLIAAGPVSYVIVAIWSLFANSRASIMASAAKPVDANTPAPQIVLPAAEADLAQLLPNNVNTTVDMKVVPQ